MKKLVDKSLTSFLLLTNGDRLLGLKDGDDEIYYVITNRSGNEIFDKRYYDKQEILMEYMKVYELRYSHNVNGDVFYERKIFNNVKEIRQIVDSMYGGTATLVFQDNNNCIEVEYDSREHCHCIDTIELLENGKPATKLILERSINNASKNNNIPANA